MCHKSNHLLFFAAVSRSVGLVCGCFCLSFAWLVKHRFFSPERTRSNPKQVDIARLHPNTIYVLVVCEIDFIFVANLDPDGMKITEHILVSRITV